MKWLTHTTYQEDPIPDTFKKLNRDPRAEAFKAKHNGKLFQVEVDALVAIAPDVFRDLVINSVDELFDEDIYKGVLEEYSEANITQIVKGCCQVTLEETQKIESTSLFR